MQLKEILLGSDLRELTPRGSPAFPIAIYDNYFEKCVPGITGSIPWHWHEEIEFQYMKYGSFEITIGSEEFLIENGEGIFINSNILHAMRLVSAKCRMITVVFDTKIISGYSKSIFEQKYIAPVISSTGLQGFKLSPAVPWQNQILQLLDETFVAHQIQNEGYEFLIRQKLSELWLAILSNNKKRLEDRLEHDRNDRIKKMLSFIQSNYADTITLQDIALVAGVSARECTRCFNKCLNTSPFSYVVDFRIREAAKLLITSNRSISDICFSVGFNNTSYFSKTFSRIIGLSPSDYRVSEKNNCFVIASNHRRYGIFSRL